MITVCATAVLRESLFEPAELFTAEVEIEVPRQMLWGELRLSVVYARVEERTDPYEALEQAARRARLQILNGGEEL